MKNLALTQILKNALEGKEGFDKIINSRDEKIAKMPEAKVENLERISNFFEKHNIRDEKQIEADIQELA